MMMMMSERKEKTMLKWLKQKPNNYNGLAAGVDGGGGGIAPIEKITDDPLATIQVHPVGGGGKGKGKGKGGNNEIYAVSRVNPLFEEELEGKEVFSPGGHSGSSGYDSGPSDDDFPPIHLPNNLAELRLHPTKNTTTALTATTGPHPTSKNGLHPPHLFINTETDVIHHETAILTPGGRPILQILEQNPAYVKSIALSVAQNVRRPLSPISEQNVGIPQAASSGPQSKYNLSTSGSLYNKDAKFHSKNNNYTTIDAIGNARLLKKDPQFVRSIRIGGAGGSGSHTTNFGTPTKRSILEGNVNTNARRYSSSASSTSSNTSIPRRPSVTFADDVGAQAGGGGKRKPSMDQDSIVTESLLMMTSHGGDHPLNRRFSNASSSSSGIATSNSRKTSISSGSAPFAQDPVDLEAFANSLRKSRPIKHIKSGAVAGGEEDDVSGTTNQAQATTSSGEDDPPLPSHIPPMPPNESGRPLSASSSSPPPRNVHHLQKSPKSPFGGIADHYAAAKEIAKEIESYSNGSAKASTKKSLVRDLLYRGSRNASASSSLTTRALSPVSPIPSKINLHPISTHYHNDNAIKPSPGHTGFLRPTSREHINSPSPTSPPTHYMSVSSASSRKKATSSTSPTALYSGSSISNSGNSNSGSAGSSDWELVRVQQVYVKAPSPSTSPRSTVDDRQGQGNNNKPTSTLTSASTIATASTQRRHNASSSSTASSSSSSSIAIATSRGKAAKTQHPNNNKVTSSPSTSSAANEGLPGARSLLRIQNAEEEHDSTDSGNHSDHQRTYAEVRLEIEGAPIIKIHGDDSRIQVEGRGDGADDHTPGVEDEGGGLSSTLQLPSKVMIVTGDSQNIVVDLSGVPLDLKNAIVSGTALITLPDGLDTMLQPGYTMITIPATQNQSSSRKHAGASRSSHRGRGDDVKPLVTSGGGGRSKASAGLSSDDECKLFATKNKAQIWDVLQQNKIDAQGEGDEETGGRGSKSKKKITTIFPFHPNQDSHESPDFTIEGHRMDRQRKKVESGKKRRCICRLCGILVFLVAFLGVLVALSMVYTRGQRYFGSV